MKKLLQQLKTAFSEWNRREAPRMGASLAFYSLLSLAPLIVIVVGICALLFGAEQARAQLVEQFRRLVGGNAAAALEGLLKSAQQPAAGIVANVIGIGTLLLGASGVLVELRAALNQLWGIPQPASANGVVTMIKDRIMSFGMVLGIGFLLLVSLLISAALAFISSYFGGLGLPATFLEILNFVLSIVVITWMFAMILRYVPDVRLPWRLVTRGAAVTAILFTLGKTAIGLYLGKAGIGSPYGAAGSLVVLIVWIYYSAQIFYYGAIFTHISAERPSEIASYRTG